MNVGISIPFQNKDISKILENVYKYAKSNYAIRDVRYKSSEFVTLDLIENDCKNGIIKDDDFVLYLHSKGASYIDRDIKRFENTQSWRRIMEYFLIEKHKDVFNIFNKTDFITIATTRPETIFADTAIAVNPNDIRYKKLINKFITKQL